MQKIILKIDKEEYEWLEKDIECYMLSSSLSKDFISGFFKKANKLDKIVLSYGERVEELCKENSLDGVFVDLSNSEEIKQDIDSIRKNIGEDKFLGIVSRTRRHEAMIVSENEPDFVAFKVWKDGFDGVKELIDWYLEFFLLQLAIEPQDVNVSLEAVNFDMLILDIEKYKILVEKK